MEDSGFRPVAYKICTWALASDCSPMRSSYSRQQSALHQGDLAASVRTDVHTCTLAGMPVLNSTYGRVSGSVDQPSANAVDA